MDTEANKLTVRRFLEGIFTSPDILDEVCTTDLTAHWRDETFVSSLDQLKKEFRADKKVHHLFFKVRKKAFARN